MMRYHSAVVFVNDIKRSHDFYTNVLNLEKEHDFGKNIIFKHGLSIWEVSPDHVIAKNTRRNPEIHNVELYFETCDLEKLIKRLEDFQIRMLHPMIEEPWGQRTIRFFDPDNHIVEAGEPLEVFIKRMHQEGMSFQEIHLKSGVDISFIESLI